MFIKEPYRLFFPLGILLLLSGIFIWLPQIWNPGDYPVLLHRYLMLNGFVAFFIGGFLMTAVPKFSKTHSAQNLEVLSYLSLGLLGIVFAFYHKEKLILVISVLQPILILLFLLNRFFNRQENPPYSFVFIFVGLILWMGSALGSLFIDLEAFKHIHYEGAIGAIILGVGSRLIPGILGHVEIVRAQREIYEKPKSLLAAVPPHFFVTIFSYVFSYFLTEPGGPLLRALSVGVIAFFYWRIHKLPLERTVLTFCIWFSAWMIVISFFLRACWSEGAIHASHAFFINGIVLLSLLIATRVIQSHGPKDKNLENLNLLYGVSFLIFLAAAGRVSAFLFPDSYLAHLGYSAFLLGSAVLLWAWRYLRFVRIQN